MVENVISADTAIENSWAAWSEKYCDAINKINTMIESVSTSGSTSLMVIFTSIDIDDSVSAQDEIPKYLRCLGFQVKVGDGYFIISWITSMITENKI